MSSIEFYIVHIRNILQYLHNNDIDHTIIQRDNKEFKMKYLDMDTRMQMLWAERESDPEIVQNPTRV